MPTAAARSSSGPNDGSAGRRPGGVQGRSIPAFRARVAARVAFGARQQHDACLAGRDASGRVVERAERRLATGRVHAAATGREVETEPLGHQAGEVVVGPGPDRHQFERVDPVDQRRASVGLGSAGGGEDQRQWFGRCRTVVVAVGDLSDPDDDGNRGHAASTARSLLAGIPGSLTLTRWSHRRARGSHPT